MANTKHLKILKQGVVAWNNWRENHNEIPDLSRADLSGADLIAANLSRADLIGADLSGANLSLANLSGADLIEANLSRGYFIRANLLNAVLVGANLIGADLSGAIMIGADLSSANLSGVHLIKATLSGADLRRAVFIEADLSGADLNSTLLIETNFEGAMLTGCNIYGVSAWNLKTNQDTKQCNLVITRHDEPVITVDNLKVAQFIYLMLNNSEIRDVIDTITSKLVLILGRFTENRIAVLNAIREELRGRNYLPVLFDFSGPSNRDITETVSTLAHMARYVIADLTDAKSLPQELTVIAPNLPSVPIKPLLHSSDREYGMFEHIKRYHSVLDIYHYDDLNQLLHSLDKEIIIPAEEKVLELTRK